MYILAIIGGVLTTLSMVINSSLGKRIGVLQSTLINYIVGLLCSMIVLLIVGSNVELSMVEFENIPIFVFCGGIIGVVIVYTSNIIIPKIPVVYSMLLLFIGQIVAGIIIDFLINKKIEINKILGAMVVTIGILYNSKVDNKICSDN
ncbi:DMT family transporter [Clostridium senegalense]|uniref:DMT family transporter n=1 Tax=Clostridium senegalense TaxID=1465809 RepID=UPI001C10178E|nr:DMT family transporter [Clostridium senegalense]MBU5227614.1 DMT family transporter [Clostridium senegalense]